MVTETESIGLRRTDGMWKEAATEGLKRRLWKRMVSDMHENAEEGDEEDQVREVRIKTLNN